MKNIKIILLTISLTVILSACYYDNEEFLYPELSTNCDTVNITYTNQISKIMNENCVSCHGASYEKDGGGLKFDNYESVLADLDNIINAVNHKDGYSAMPKNGGKLSSCALTQFDLWKKNGTPLN